MRKTLSSNEIRKIWQSRFTRRYLFGVILLTCILIGCGPDTNEGNNWMIGPFEKMDHYNPCLLPSENLTFLCPVRNEIVQFEEKDVFNPAVIKRQDQVHMIYRAEDSIGIHNGTSRLGLALSIDGLRFSKRESPVLFPDNDIMKVYEWEGGIEDPRIVETNSGRYIMTYTSYDGKLARLCVASSDDLIHWTKHGLAFNGVLGRKYEDTWSKSGSIVCEVVGERLLAKRINGLFWMYWGDKDIHLASSEDLVTWTPIEENGVLKKILSPRPGYFDSDLVEPGPPAILTSDGILLLYNGRNYGEERDQSIEDGTYSAGQALFDSTLPEQILKRSEKNFFRPERDYEITGQVNKVVFIQGLVIHEDALLLYYGTADSKIAVARAELPW